MTTGGSFSNQLPTDKARELGNWCLNEAKNYSSSGATKGSNESTIERFGQQVYQHVVQMAGIGGSAANRDTSTGKPIGP